MESAVVIVEIAVITLLFWNCSLPSLDNFRPRLTKTPVLHWTVNHTADCYRVCPLGRLYAFFVIIALALSYANIIPNILPTIIILIGALVSLVCNWDAALYFLLLLLMDLARYYSTQFDES